MADKEQNPIDALLQELISSRRSATSFFEDLDSSSFVEGFLKVSSSKLNESVRELVQFLAETFSDAGIQNLSRRIERAKISTADKKSLGEGLSISKDISDILAKLGEHLDELGGESESLRRELDFLINSFSELKTYTGKNLREFIREYQELLDVQGGSLEEFIDKMGGVRQLGRYFYLSKLDRNQYREESYLISQPEFFRSFEHYAKLIGPEALFKSTESTIKRAVEDMKISSDIFSFLGNLPIREKIFNPDIPAITDFQRNIFKRIPQELAQAKQFINTSLLELTERINTLLKVPESERDYITLSKLVTQREELQKRLLALLREEVEYRQEFNKRIYGMFLEASKDFGLRTVDKIFSTTRNPFVDIFTESLRFALNIGSLVYSGTRNLLDLVPIIPRGGAPRTPTSPPSPTTKSPKPPSPGPTTSPKTIIPPILKGAGKLVGTAGLAYGFGVLEDVLFEKKPLKESLTSSSNIGTGIGSALGGMLLNPFGLAPLGIIGGGILGSYVGGLFERDQKNISREISLKELAERTSRPNSLFAPDTSSNPPASRPGTFLAPNIPPNPPASRPDTFLAQNIPPNPPASRPGTFFAQNIPLNPPASRPGTFLAPNIPPNPPASRPGTFLAPNIPPNPPASRPGTFLAPNIPPNPPASRPDTFLAPNIPSNLPASRPGTFLAPNTPPNPLASRPGTFFAPNIPLNPPALTILDIERSREERKYKDREELTSSVTQSLQNLGLAALTTSGSLNNLGLSAGKLSVNFGELAKTSASFGAGLISAGGAFIVDFYLQSMNKAYDIYYQQFAQQNLMPQMIRRQLGTTTAEISRNLVTPGTGLLFQGPLSVAGLGFERTELLAGASRVSSQMLVRNAEDLATRLKEAANAARIFGTNLEQGVEAIALLRKATLNYSDLFTTSYILTRTEPTAFTKAMAEAVIQASLSLSIQQGISPRQYLESFERVQTLFITSSNRTLSELARNNIELTRNFVNSFNEFIRSGLSNPIVGGIGIRAGLTPREMLLGATPENMTRIIRELSLELGLPGSLVGGRFSGQAREYLLPLIQNLLGLTNISPDAFNEIVLSVITGRATQAQRLILEAQRISPPRAIPSDRDFARNIDQLNISYQQLTDVLERNISAITELNKAINNLAATVLNAGNEIIPFIFDKLSEILKGVPVNTKYSAKENQGPPVVSQEMIDKASAILSSSTFPYSGYALVKIERVPEQFTTQLIEAMVRNVNKRGGK
jgi:hypothetical protein